MAGEKGTGVKEGVPGAVVSGLSLCSTFSMKAGLTQGKLRLLIAGLLFTVVGLQASHLSSLCSVFLSTKWEMVSLSILGRYHEKKLMWIVHSSYSVICLTYYILSTNLLPGTMLGRRILGRTEADSSPIKTAQHLGRSTGPGSGNCRCYHGMHFNPQS